MNGPREVLLLGGPADGERLTVLYGQTVKIRKGEVEADYYIARLAGSTKPFFVGVPPGRELDGDWVLDRLLTDYHDRRAG